jgi:hypothetical protein
MAITWTDYPNGESLLTIRNSINTFNNSVVVDVNKNTTDIGGLDTRVTSLETTDYIDFTPQVTPPTHTEGRAYYDDTKKTFVGVGPYPDAPIDIGHSMHAHIINNSGAIIEKGMAVRHDGVNGAGIVQVQKAVADSFVNAEIFGVAQHEIGIGETGAISTFGEIFDLDTSTYTAGVPLYLSDTVPGTYVETAPDIISRVGGVTVSDLTAGKLFVAFVNNTNLPTIYGGLQGQTTPLYNVSTTVQDIDGYLTEEESVVTVDALTGVVTLPNAGAYRLNFTADISFPSAITTRSVIFEVYDVTAAGVAYTYTKNIPRDATDDGLSFSFPAQAVVNNEIKMRIRSNVAIDVTFNSIVFDIQSVNIR